MKKEDSINPSHYLKFEITPYEYIVKNNLGWEQGNAIKYITRYEDKNGIEDLQKAIKYIELLIERIEDASTLKDKNWNT